MKYDTTKSGHTCDKCGANFLTRRPWRLGLCIPCYEQERPKLFTIILIAFFIGVLSILGGCCKIGLVGVLDFGVVSILVYDWIEQDA
jgi:hypothetical protein